MTYKKGALQKVEKQFAENGFKIRYERGNFKAGYCLVKDSKVIIVNKFYNKEARYNCLIEISKTNGFEEELKEEEVISTTEDSPVSTELITP